MLIVIGGSCFDMRGGRCGVVCVYTYFACVLYVCLWRVGLCGDKCEWVMLVCIKNNFMHL